MSNITCIPSISYYSTPEFLANCVHLIIAFSTPFHFLGLYIILTKTPKPMASIKWIFVNFHIWIVAYDHFLGTLSIPFLLLPSLSGFSLGILPKFGVPDVLIVILVLLACGYVLISILTIFENRFHIVCTYSWKVYWDKIRIPFLLFHYILGMVVFIPFWFLMPEQEAARSRVFETLPCLPSYIHEYKLFVLNDNYYHFVTLITFVLIGSCEVATFSGLLFYSIFEQVRFKKMSKKTLKMQVKFMMALIIQMLIPSFCLLVPLFYFMYTVVYNYYHQAYMNFAIIIQVFHGLISTVVMILVHYPYRVAFLNMFWFKSSKSESRVGNLAKTSIGPTQC